MAPTPIVSREHELDASQGTEIGHHGVARLDIVETGAGARGDDVSGPEAATESRLLVGKPSQHVHRIAQRTCPLAAAARLAVDVHAHAVRAELEPAPSRRPSTGYQGNVGASVGGHEVTAL